MKAAVSLDKSVPAAANATPNEKAKATQITKPITPAVAAVAAATVPPAVSDASALRDVRARLDAALVAASQDQGRVCRVKAFVQKSAELWARLEANGVQDVESRDGLAARITAEANEYADRCARTCTRTSSPAPAPTVASYALVQRAHPLLISWCSSPPTLPCRASAMETFPSADPMHAMLKTTIGALKEQQRACNESVQTFSELYAAGDLMAADAAADEFRPKLKALITCAKGRVSSCSRSWGRGWRRRLMEMSNPNEHGHHRPVRPCRRFKR